MIRHTCPNCDHKLTNSDCAAGMTIRCSRCYSHILVPSPDDELDFADAQAAPSASRQADSSIDSYADSADDTTGNKFVHRTALLLLPVILAGLALLLAGNLVWVIVAAIGGALVAGFGLAVLRVMMEGENVPGSGWEYLGYYAFLLALWISIGYWFQVGQVHIDNFSNQNLRVLVDGKEWATCGEDTTHLKTLSAGSHHITVTDADGNTLDEMQVDVERQSVYVLNLLRAQRYYKGTQDYGGFGFGSPPSETEIRDAWFEPKVDYLFTVVPSEITVSSRKGQPVLGATRSYLRRGRIER